MPALQALTVDATVLRIFRQRPAPADEPYTFLDTSPDSNVCDLDWYCSWLAHQTSTLPSEFLEILPNTGSATVSISSVESAFSKVFYAISEYVCPGESRGIDKIIEHLVVQRRLLLPDDDDTYTNLRQRYLVFAILGWQSMLFLPSFNTCPLNELAVYQDINQPNSRLVFDTFKMSTDLTDREMAVLLKGYGNLLPARPPELAQVASETSKVASAWSSIVLADINVHMLSTLLRVRIHWVETLSHHLDYDQTTRTLCLFRFPSFCVAML